MMGKDKELFKKLVVGMAFTRDKWVNRASQRLEGALGEYAKLKYSKLIDFDDYWSDEVTTLMGKVVELFDTNVVKTRQKFNRYTAFQEAIFDSLGSQEQITSARNEFLRYLNTPEERQLFLKASTKSPLMSETLLMEMIQEYMPKDLLEKLDE